MTAVPISAEVESNTLSPYLVVNVEYMLVPDLEVYEERSKFPTVSLPSGQRFPAIVMPDKED